MKVSLIVINLTQLVLILEFYLETDAQKIGFARPMGRN